MKLIVLNRINSESPDYCKYVAIVDDEDFGELNKWGWSSTHRRPHTTYAYRTIRIDGKQKKLYMHRQITGFPNEVDHIDGNGLNNQRSNLRICTNQQNMGNRRAWKNSISKYLGVSLVRSKYKDRVYIYWVAQIMNNGKRKHLGYFKTEIEAAKAYNNHASKIHGEFARLNVIEKQ